MKAPYRGIGADSHDRCAVAGSRWSSAVRPLLPGGLIAGSLLAASAGVLSEEPPPPDLAGALRVVVAAVDDGRSERPGCGGWPAAAFAEPRLRPATFAPGTRARIAEALSPEQAAWQRCVAMPPGERHACFHELLTACG